MTRTTRIKLILVAFLLSAATAFPFLLGGLATNPASTSEPGILSYSPELWLDPSDDGGRTASTLLDRSGNSNNFDGASAGLTFVTGPNSKTVASYDGSGYGYLASGGYSGPSLTTFEIWYVAKRTNDGGNATYARFLTFSGKFSLGFHTDPGYGPLQIVMNSGTDYKAAVSLDLTDYHVYRLTYSSGTWAVWQDGVSKTVSSAGDYAGLSGVSSRIGGGEYDSQWIGNHGDIIVFPRILNSTEAAVILSILQTKWGL